MARLAPSDRGARQGTTRGYGEGQCRAEAREGRFGGDQRVVGVLPRDARRRERGRLLPDVRQRVLALCADKQEADEKAAERIVEPRELPFIQEALASIAEGGYPEALARVACLLARKGEPLLLSRRSVRRKGNGKSAGRRGRNREE